MGLINLPVIPVKTGIQAARHELEALVTGFRRYDRMSHRLIANAFGVKHKRKKQ